MPLDESVTALVGDLLLVQTVFGWGWHGNEQAPAPPPPFRVRLRRIWSASGERRGGVGTVEEPGHRYHGYCAVFSDRHVGTYNFTTAPTAYNVFISATEPADTHEDGWPVLHRGSGDAEGFAEIVSAAAAG